MTEMLIHIIIYQLDINSGLKNNKDRILILVFYLYLIIIEWSRDLIQD